MKRREVLKWIATLPLINAAEIWWVALPRELAKPWSNILLWWHTFEDVLSVLRSEFSVSGILENGREERASVIKILLRTLFEKRASHWRILNQRWLDEDLQIILEIRKNCSPALLEEVFSAPDFMTHCLDEEYIDVLTPDIIDAQIRDVRRLFQLWEIELNEEYSQRRIDVTQNNFQIIINSLIGITTWRNWFDITCRMPIDFWTISIIQDSVWKRIASWVYHTEHSYISWVNGKTSISDWVINSITIIWGRWTYTFPKIKITDLDEILD